MKVAQFKAFLLQLAEQLAEAGEMCEAKALRKLAELFDEGQNLKVAQLVEHIRRVSRLQEAG